MLISTEGRLMPRIQASKKSLKQDRKKQIKNSKIKKELKKLKKSAISSLNKKEKDAPEKVKKSIIIIDKAVKNHIIHKNKAGHIKSKLLKKLNSIKMTLPKKVKKPAPKKKAVKAKNPKKVKPVKKSKPIKTKTKK